MEGRITGRLGHAPHRVVRRGVRLEADEVAATLRRLHEISNALTAWTLQLGWALLVGADLGAGLAEVFDSLGLLEGKVRV